MRNNQEILSTDQANENEVDTFPSLVFKELIAIVLAMALLCVVSLMFDAPLKAMADPNWTENPAKAPWYFVGLQELLVYFDPWIAGVCVPLLIVFGLAAIPYLDPNPAGVGRYAIGQRRLAAGLFLFGYALWFILIGVGQFLRGPSWQFYWPWEDWSVHKPIEESLFNLPNWAGCLLILVYFGAGLLLPAVISRRHIKVMGLVRYVIAWSLALLMAGVVGKIVLRLAFGVKYIVSTHAFSI